MLSAAECPPMYLDLPDLNLGPSLLAFVSPNVLGVLVKNFDIKPITTVDEDLKAAVAGK